MIFQNSRQPFLSLPHSCSFFKKEGSSGQIRKTEKAPLQIAAARDV
jgi:hypothetical protein